MAHDATLLLTRPRVASERFARQLHKALGVCEIVISPLLRIDPLPLTEPDLTAETLVFTSQNGVEAWSQAGRSFEGACFCVGQATADAARKAGFDPQVCGGTVDHILSDLITARPAQPILHVHGAHTRGDLVARLTENGLNAHGVTAYTQTLVDLNAQALGILQGGGRVIVPLFSPRTAAQFAKAAPFNAQVDILALSRAVAECCPGAKVVAGPTADQMIEAIMQSLSR